MATELANLADSTTARRWVHLPVETKSRSFHARILLACAAAERGFGAVVGQKGHVAKMANALPPGIYIEKSGQRQALSGIETRSALGHRVCCLDEEGVVYIDADDYVAGRLSRPVLDRFVRFFAWGQDQADVVTGFHPSVADRIAVTGNPRVDFWRPELRELHRPAADALGADGPFVLFTTAFAMVNNTRGDDYFVDTLRSNGRFETADGAARVNGYLDHSRTIFDALGEAVEVLARNRPSIPIVIRPHPSEDIEPWEKIAADFDNVTVRREGAVTPWLLAATAVVHNNSTTGLEAALLGRPTVAFAPVTDVRFDQNLPNQVSHPASTIDELIGLLDRAWAGDEIEQPPDRLAYLQHHLASLDGALACDRLADDLLSIDVPEARLGGGTVRAATSQLRLGRLRVARRLGRAEAPELDIAATKAETAAGNKFPPTDVGEVVAFIDELVEATGRFSGLQCQELSDRVFAIAPNP